MTALTHGALVAHAEWLCDRDGRFVLDATIPAPRSASTRTPRRPTGARFAPLQPDAARHTAAAAPTLDRLPTRQTVDEVRL